MPSRTSLVTRSVFLLVAAALTAAAVRGARPDPDGSAGGLRARYGAPVAMGNGQARTYVMLDERSGKPVEVGVACRRLSATPPRGSTRRATASGGTRPRANTASRSRGSAGGTERLQHRPEPSLVA
jgi:hypothetical protein